MNKNDREIIKGLSERIAEREEKHKKDFLENKKKELQDFIKFHEDRKCYMKDKDILYCVKERLELAIRAETTESAFEFASSLLALIIHLEIDEEIAFSDEET